MQPIRYEGLPGYTHEQVYFPPQKLVTAESINSSNSSVLLLLILVVLVLILGYGLKVL